MIHRIHIDIQYHTIDKLSFLKADSVEEVFISSGRLFHNCGPLYFIDRLPYLTVLNVGSCLLCAERRVRLHELLVNILLR